MELELLNALMPKLLEIAGILLLGVATWLGGVIADYFKDLKHSRIIKEIIKHTVEYVKMVGDTLEADKKKQLAIEQATALAKEKGIIIGAVELNILIESFVYELKQASKIYEEPDIFEVTLEDDGAQSEVS